MRIFVTGGCGFIGTNLVAKLLATGGSAIRILDNESLGKRAHLPPGPVDFVHGDIGDAATVRRCLRDIDAVVHLAADTRVIESIENPGHNFASNVAGTFVLLEEMRRADVTRLVNASTGGAIIGEAEPPVHEGMVPKPLSPYGASKLAVEGYCSAYAASYGFQALSLRFSNVYGPRSFHKGSVVAAFFKAVLRGAPLTIYGDGAQTRDYVNVSDICDGIVAALASDQSGVLQLGSGRPLSLNDLIDRIEAAVAPQPIIRRHLPPRAGEVRHTYCDIALARRTIGFEPRVPLDAGLREAWAWFRQHEAGAVGAAAELALESAAEGPPPSPQP